MWLHESESNSIITEAYENKIFLTIIYISNNRHESIKKWNTFARRCRKEISRPVKKYRTLRIHKQDS